MKILMVLTSHDKLGDTGCKVPAPSHPGTDGSVFFTP
jgi:hypothetical protein